MPGWAFGSMVAGGIWLCLWSSKLRLFGFVPVALGSIAAILFPKPDLLVTGDGRHLAVIAEDGVPQLLRDRAGVYMRSLLSEASGFDGDPAALGARHYSACSRDSCVATLRKGNREWRLLATLSPAQIDWAALTRACAEADVVVSSRRLPRGCAAG